jgi:prepilin-type N-terminal cleavage/methylation domain-containing protein
MSRLGLRQVESGFTLAELLITMAIGSAILGVIFTSAIALQKSFTAVDNYFGAHMQQIRIVDYLARDVRRGLSVTSSTDRRTVTIKIPKYIIQAGDSDATVSNIGTPRSPSLAIGNGDYNINYGTSTSTVTTVVYSVNASSIRRTEDGELTTIASSTDNLIPETVDIELANTEYTTTAITFKPISVADRSGTVVYSTAYLRNRRRSL